MKITGKKHVSSTFASVRGNVITSPRKHHFGFYIVDYSLNQVNAGFKAVKHKA